MLLVLLSLLGAGEQEWVSPPPPGAGGHQRRMDPGTVIETLERVPRSSYPGTLDPGLLQAVLEDPVLLQAVDPRVLQAVLVSAAQATRTVANLGPPTLPESPRAMFPDAPRNTFPEAPMHDQFPTVPEDVTEAEEFEESSKSAAQEPLEFSSGQQQSSAGVNLPRTEHKLRNQNPFRTLNQQAVESGVNLPSTVRQLQNQNQFGPLNQNQFGLQTQNQFGFQNQKQNNFGLQNQNKNQFGFQNQNQNQNQFGFQNQNQNQFSIQNKQRNQFGFLNQNQGSVGASINQPVNNQGFSLPQNEGSFSRQNNRGINSFNRPQDQVAGFRGNFGQAQSGGFGNQNPGAFNQFQSNPFQGLLGSTQGGFGSLNKQRQNNDFGRSFDSQTNTNSGFGRQAEKQTQPNFGVETFGGFAQPLKLRELGPATQEQHQQRQPSRGPQIVSLPNLAPGQHEQRLEQPRAPRDQGGPGSFEEALEGASQVLGLDPAEVAAALQANPDIAQELARQIESDPGLAEALGLSAFFTNPQPTHEDQILLPSPPFSAYPPGVCSLVTLNGHPCDPGLAFSPVTGSCEWPDVLIEFGCNPEVVTGFGPCPQNAGDPRLTPAQIASWPQPKFPVNLDVVTVQNFDAFLAKKFFVVCVPTPYGKLFPRLICCPDHTFFDPFHIDGCVHDLALHDLPPPTFGSPDPYITHVGAPLARTKRSVEGAAGNLTTAATL